MKKILYLLTMLCSNFTLCASSSFQQIADFTFIKQFLCFNHIASQSSKDTLINIKEAQKACLGLPHNSYYLFFDKKKLLELQKKTPINHDFHLINALLKINHQPHGPLYIKRGDLE